MLRIRNGWDEHAQKTMTLSDFIGTYRKHVTRLARRHSREQAMSLAVGGHFQAIGQLEYYLLLQHGLQKRHTVVDVGCGSGRLAVQLKHYLDGRYVGLDVVPTLHRYAKEITARADWAFLDAPGLTIPQPDNSADFICFFSVLTHLTHEQSYRYLDDAKRVLKPGGRIVFSFIEFRVPSHWQFFQVQADGRGRGEVLNQFISRDGIDAWTAHLGLRVLDIFDGDKPHIRLLEPVRFDNGIVQEGLGNLGQSVCVLTKD